MNNPIFSNNAMQIITKRYLKRNDEGKVIETASQMLNRVASNIASIDKKTYGSSDVETKKTSKEFYDMMAAI